MFTKAHRSVSSICDSFTKELELTQVAEETKAQLLADEIAERTKALALAKTEVVCAKTAIDNIRKLFGKETL